VTAPVWKPDRVGEPIAERRLTLRRRGVRPKGVRVRFGKPVRAADPARGDPWWCPVEITGLRSRSFTAVPGVDSLQALVLALEYVTRVLPAEAKRMGGRIEWLAERERPVFGQTFMLQVYEKAVSNLRQGLELAAPLIRGSAVSPAKRAKVEERLKRLVKTSGFQRIRLPRTRRAARARARSRR
jgi:hypothetical protein